MALECLASIARKRFRAISLGFIGMSRGAFKCAIAFRHMTINGMSDALAMHSPLDACGSSRVVNMSSMFNRVLAFKQSVGDWDTSSVTEVLQRSQKPMAGIPMLLYLRGTGHCGEALLSLKEYIQSNFKDIQFDDLIIEIKRISHRT